MSRKYITKNGNTTNYAMNSGQMYKGVYSSRNFCGFVLNDKDSSKENKAVAGAYLRGSKDGYNFCLKKYDKSKYDAKMARYRANKA